MRTMADTAEAWRLDRYSAQWLGVAGEAGAVVVVVAGSDSSEANLEETLLEHLYLPGPAYLLKSNQKM
jgi:hypothetical protein